MGEYFMNSKWENLGGLVMLFGESLGALLY